MTDDHIAYSPDGHKLAFGGASGDVTVWDTTSGKQLSHYPADADGINSLAFSSDNESLITGGGDQRILISNVQNPALKQQLSGHSNPVSRVSFSPDGSTMFTLSSERDPKHSASGYLSVMRRWDLGHSTMSAVLDANDHIWMRSDDKTLACLEGDDEYINIWDTDAMKMTTEIHASDRIQDCVLTPDGNRLVVLIGSVAPAKQTKPPLDWPYRNIMKVVTFPLENGSPKSGKETTLCSYDDNDTARLIYIAVSPDSKKIAVSSKRYEQQSITIWDADSAKQLAVIKSSGPGLGFSPDSRSLVAGNSLWNVSDGKLLGTFGKDHSSENAIYVSSQFSHDGKMLARAVDGQFTVWDVPSGKQLQSASGGGTPFTSLSFLPNDKIMAASNEDGTVAFWSTNDWKRVCTVVPLDQDDWVVVDAQGRFDASSEGMRLMHWRIGNEIVDLTQLKQRYYEPNLLPKLLGVNQQPLRPVPSLIGVKLFPEVSVEKLSQDGKLHLLLKNRGGGIGKLEVRLNGKEIAEDAVARDANRNAEEAETVVDLSNAAILQGAQNKITIVAHNSDNDLASRDITLSFDVAATADAKPPDLDLYAIVAGVSHYSDSALDLKYSSKDALDFAKALSIGGTRMFGAQHVHVAVLANAPDGSAVLPTHANLEKAFLKLPRRSRRIF